MPPAPTRPNVRRAAFLVTCVALVEAVALASCGGGEGGGGQPPATTDGGPPGDGQAGDAGPGLGEAGADAGVAPSDAGLVDAGRQWVYFAGGQAGDRFLGYGWEPSTRTLTPIDADPNEPGLQPFQAETLPVALAAHASGRWVYAVNALAGSVSAFAHDAATGHLTRLAANEADGGRDAPLGAQARFLAADPKGRVLYALRAPGTLVTLAVNGATGTLTLARETPTAALAEWIAVDAAARFLLVGGTGGELTVHRLDAATGLPVATDGPLGPGTAYPVPRGASHVALRPDGATAFVGGIDVGAIRSFSVDPSTLALTPLQTIADAGAAVAFAVDPAGKFLYAADRVIEVRPLAPDGTVGAVLGSVTPVRECIALSFVPGGATLFGHCFGGAKIAVDSATGAMSPPQSGQFGVSRNVAWVIR